MSKSGLIHHHDVDYQTWLSRPKHQRLALHEEVVSSESSIQHLNDLVENSSLCVIFVPELIDDEWFEQFDKKNVLFFMAGILNSPESDQGLIDREQWYRAVLKELMRTTGFQSNYANVADPSWPSLQNLWHTTPVPRHVVDELCQQLDQYPKIDIQDLPRMSEVGLVKDQWTHILHHPLFAEFYHDIKDLSWPDLNTLQEMSSPPEHIRQEILMSFQEPEQQDPYQRLDLVKDILLASGGEDRLQWARAELHCYFFWSTVDLYQRRPDLLGLLEPKADLKGFDILLGRKKRHRDLVYTNIDCAQHVVTYFQHDPQDITVSDEFIWPESILPRPNYVIKDTTQEIKVGDVITSLSQVLPIEIYNQTAFSLVCESQCDNGFSFFTEKIVKPMMAKRVFLVFSGQHYLKNLRSLGFQTFGSIFDEGYDDILRMEERGLAICDLVAQISSQDPGQIYDQAQSILEHNYRLIMSTDWQQNMCNRIKLCVDNWFGNKYSI